MQHIRRDYEFSRILFCILFASVSLAHAGFFSCLLQGCKFRKDPFSASQALFDAFLVGQPTAKQSILNAIQTWQTARDFDAPHASVTVFAGPTGTGKTLASEIVAGALLECQATSARRKGHLYISALHFYAMYSSQTDLILAIQKRIVQHLRVCGGKAVVVLDEFQKLNPSVLEALLVPLKQGRCEITDGTSSHACSQVFFIVIVDFTEEECKSLLLSSGAKQIHIGRMILQHRWKDQNLGFLASSVVPFMPVTFHSLVDITRHNLHTFAGCLSMTRHPIMNNMISNLSNEMKDVVRDLRNHCREGGRASVNKLHRVEISAQVSSVVVASAPLSRLKNTTILYSPAGARSIVEYSDSPLNAFKLRLLDIIDEETKLLDFVAPESKRVLHVYTNVIMPFPCSNGDDLCVRNNLVNTRIIVDVCEGRVVSTVASGPDDFVDVDVEASGVQSEVDLYTTGWSVFEESNACRTIISKDPQSFLKLF